MSCVWTSRFAARRSAAAHSEGLITEHTDVIVFLYTNTSLVPRTAYSSKMSRARLNLHLRCSSLRASSLAYSRNLGQSSAYCGPSRRTNTCCRYMRRPTSAHGTHAGYQLRPIGGALPLAYRVTLFAPQRTPSRVGKIPAKCLLREWPLPSGEQFSSF